MSRLRPQPPPSDPRYRSPARELANGFFWLLVIAAALYLAVELPGLLGGAMK